MNSASPAPRIIEEHGFRVEDLAEARVLSFPQVKRRVPASFLAGFTVLAATGAVLQYLLVDERLGAHTYMIWAASSALLLYLTLVAAINRIFLRADASGFRRWVSPLPWSRQRHYPLGKFRGPYAASRKRRFQPWRTHREVFDLCVLDGRARRSILIRSFEDEAAARYAARLLQRTDSDRDDLPTET